MSTTPVLRCPARARRDGRRRAPADSSAPACRAARSNPARPASGDAASPRRLRRPCARRGRRSPPRWRRAAHGRACRSRARAATRRCVQSSARVASRQTGCERGSPSTRRFMRSRSRYSSSEWKAARRRIAFRMSRTPVVVLDQQRAGGRAHEHLDAGSSPAAVRVRRARGCCRACRRYRRRSRNACGDARAATLSAERLARGGERIGVGHFEHAR